MKRAVLATRRQPKINGIRRGFAEVLELFANDADSIPFETMEIESGVAATPLSIQELMDGAATRARSAYDAAKTNLPDGDTLLAVGAEGGLWRTDTTAFLQSWVCIYDGSVMHFGSSGAIEIPFALSREVFENGRDLGMVIDRFAEQHDVRSKQGTWGVLTKDLVTREDSFAEAARHALMPFFHSTVYEKDVS
ncbi:MAG: inosine/xanthosine triphosphatase [Ignavibacteriales bacterium]|nr:inosine/xanthosine triphosphatase [Ignavibacteriales bacterium]